MSRLIQTMSGQQVDDALWISDEMRLCLRLLFPPLKIYIVRIGRGGELGGPQTENDSWRQLTVIDEAKSADPNGVLPNMEPEQVKSTKTARLVCIKSDLNEINLQWKKYFRAFILMAEEMGDKEAAAKIRAKFGELLRRFR